MWKIDKDSRTGSATRSYADALDWKFAELRQKTILLKNTHASLSLKYKLSGYAAEDSIGKELVAETIYRPARSLSSSMTGSGIASCYR